jgi:anaerobic selenocysteine-containing dehydrogenase
MRETRIGMCKICLGSCPIAVTVEDGRAVEVVGNRGSDVYGGYTCLKGRAMPETHYRESRLLHTQKRHPDGGFESIPTARAIDEIADKLRVILAEHGPQALAVVIGNGNIGNPVTPLVAASFFTALGTIADRYYSMLTLDQPGKLIALALHGRWVPGPQTFSSSDVWMIVGANPVTSKMGLSQNPAQVIKQAVRNGMKLIIVDPRASESTHHAYLHLQPQPGQDPTLLAGFLRVILTEQLYDKVFVAENAEGIAALTAHVDVFTPDHVASVTGVPVEQIVQAARTFAGARRGCVVTGTGPHFALHGSLVEYLALCLNTVCGRWVRAGEPNGQPHVLMPPITARAQPLPAYKPWDDNRRTRINNLPKTILGAPTGTIAEEILTPGNGQIRAMICTGSNIMTALPNQVRTLEALRSLDLLVCLDVDMTNTARVAHYIVPDRLGMETPGTTQLAESMKYYGMWTQGFDLPYAMYTPALIEPPEGSDVIEGWKFYYELAKRLDLPLTLQVNAAGVGQHWECPPQMIPLSFDRCPSTDEMLDYICTGSRVPLSEVKRYPNGKVYDDIDHIILPRDPACDTYLQLGDPDMMAELQQVFARRGDTALPSEEFPLLLTPRRVMEMQNSIGRTTPQLATRKPHNPAYLNPLDLERFGLKSGDLIRIRSKYGEIVGVARPEANLRPGTLSMSHGYGHNPDEEADPLNQGACTSRLLDANDDFDPIFGQPRMGAIPVAVTVLHPEG